MPDLAWNYSHRNQYSENEACVFINHLKDGTPADHKGNAITEDCDEYTEFLKMKVLPELNKLLKNYYVNDVGLHDQGNHQPCFFIFRRDNAKLSDLDMTNISNEVKKALNVINKINNKKTGFFPKENKSKEEKKALLKSTPCYSR